MTNAYETRCSVMSYMYHKGENAWRLSDAQWKAAYLQADGFGKVSLAFAEDQCWDWSHVRDSSEAAFAKMWGVICHWHNMGELKTADKVS